MVWGVYEMKIKVLTLIPASYGGGAENLVLDQIRYYNKRKVKYRVVALRRENEEDKFRQHVEFACLNVKKRFSINALVKLNRGLKNGKIQILHTHLMEADVYGFLLKILNPEIKWISTKHNNDEFRKKKFWRILNKIISIKNDKIITVSNAVKNFIIKYEWVNPRKMIVLTNGIDTKRFRKISDTKIRGEYKIDKNDFVVGIVGRLNYQKGHIFLLGAIKLLKDKIKNLKVLIIGNGELEEELKCKCKEYGIEQNVIFGGFRKDMEYIYNSFDVFCLPSRFEGLPLVIIEAMACERYCIGSDIPNNLEVIKNKSEGVLVKIGDVNKIAQEIYYAYKNPLIRQKKGKKARVRVLKDFEFRDNLRKIEEVYGELL